MKWNRFSPWWNGETCCFLSFGFSRFFLFVCALFRLKLFELENERLRQEMSRSAEEHEGMMTQRNDLVRSLRCVHSESTENGPSSSSPPPTVFEMCAKNKRKKRARKFFFVMFCVSWGMKRKETRWHTQRTLWVSCFFTKTPVFSQKQNDPGDKSRKSEKRMRS